MGPDHSFKPVPLRGSIQALGGRRMKSWVAVALLPLAGLCCAGCRPSAGSAGCTVEGPARLVPENVKRIHLGISRAELERILGEADYSPAEGQFYFSTGGECPLEDADREAPCGVVAEFRRTTHDATLGRVPTDSLQSCWWGGIGE